MNFEKYFNFKPCVFEKTEILIYSSNTADILSCNTVFWMNYVTGEYNTITKFAKMSKIGPS